jgi:acyl-coenzyme A thioesterase PaaI-like protein
MSADPANRVSLPEAATRLDDVYARMLPHLLDAPDGGPRYPEFLDRVRTFMDRAKAANPTPEVADRAIQMLDELNDLLAGVEVPEWQTPAWSQRGLPSRGSITVPPITITAVEGDQITATVRMSRYHLGGGAAAHGGQIGVVFDYVLAAAGLIVAESPMRTAYLNINYRSLTPLDTDLVATGRIDRIDGRKIYISGELRDGDRLCADADSMFLKLQNTFDGEAG